ncbi:MAG: AAA family ATPase [Ruthenibacterium lactatiformans]
MGDEAGQLTEKVRCKPYSVVLFDETRKRIRMDEPAASDPGRRKINDAQGAGQF